MSNRIIICIITTLIMLCTCHLFSMVERFSADILLDASGSMKGFANTGAITKIISELEEAVEVADLPHSISCFNFDGSKYIQEEIDINSLRDIEFYGPTLLERAIENNIKSNIILLITDNVYDDGTVSGQNTEIFYEKIRDFSSVIDIIPLIAKYDGNPYVKGEKVHKGNRGLLIYFLLNKNIISENDKYNKIIRSLEDKHEILHILPINSNHIILESLDKNEHFIIEKLGPDYGIKFLESKKFSPVFYANKLNEIDFSFSIKSKYRHVKLIKGTEVKITKIKVEPEFITNCDVKISPKRLNQNIEHLQGKEEFKCKISIFPKLNIRDELKLIFQRTKLKISFGLLINSSQNGLFLSDSFNSKYFTRNINDLDKIYSPIDYMNYFNNINSNITLKMYNKNDDSNPPTILIMKPRDSFVINFFFIISGVMFALAIIFYLLKPQKIYLYLNNDFVEEYVYSVVFPKSYIHNCFSIYFTKNIKVYLKNGWTLRKNFSSQQPFVIFPTVNYEIINESLDQTINLLISNEKLI
ncbi:MAG: hypothetical protein JW870_11230 [Candidatus Delongbacteria bacterium]|nr:hypothetical protein [Candidatus Delongbacteria bacterium]